MIRNSVSQKVVLYLGLFLFAFLYFYLIVTTDRLPNIYQARDIYNSVKLLGGENLWAGPDLLGGGKAPGPFYYWILALPLAVFHSWEILPVYAVFLAALAATLLFKTIKTNFSETEAYFTYLFFLNSFVIQKNLINLWNPSYLYLFQVILIGVFLDVRRMPFKFLLAGMLLLALTIQIHLMQVLFAAAIFYSLLKQNLKFAKMGLLAFTFLLPFVPFFLNALPAAGPAGYPMTFLKPLNDLFVEVNVEYIKSFGKNFLSFFKNNLAYDLFFFSNLIFLLFYFRKVKLNNYFLKSLLIASAFMLIWVCDNPSLLRYMVPFSLVFCVYLGKFFQQFVSESRLLPYWAGGVIFSIAVNFYLRRNQLDGINFQSVLLILASCGFAILGLPKFSRTGVISMLFVATSAGLVLKANSFAIVLPTDSAVETYSNFGNISSENKSDTVLLLKEIITKTSWKYSEFRQRSFVLGFSREADLSLLYNSLYDEGAKKVQTSNYDGLVAVRKSMQGGESALLPVYLQQLFEEKKIICESETQTQKFTLCFYRGPAKINNIGYAYLNPELTDYPNGGTTESIQFDTCSGDGTECKVLFSFRREGSLLLFTATGNPISVPDTAVNPSGVSQFSGLKLTSNCTGAKPQILNFGTIGFEKSRKTFLAPFETAIPLNCENPKLKFSGRHIFFKKVSEKSEPADFEYALEI